MHIKKIMDYYALNLYSNNYSTVSGTIQFDQIHDHLKQHISPITSELKEKYPRINYFAKVNPNWNIGHELVCIAEFPLLFPLKYGIKVVKKNTYYYLSFIKKYIESLKFNKKFKNLSKNKA
jgi:hypothetical protein